MTAILFSDVHLSDHKSMKTKLLVRFLQEKASQFENVYILGDLFDAWPVTSKFLIKRFDPVIQALRSLVEGNRIVHYFEGNHDFHLGNFFEQSLGIRTHASALTEVWDGKRAYLAHGDLDNPNNWSYRLLRSVLRSSMVKHTAKALPQKLVFDIALRFSNWSRRYQKKSGKDGDSIDAEVKAIYRQSAEELFTRGYDIVIMGHTHQPDEMTSVIGGRTCRYINTGDWLSHFTYVEFDGTQFYTKTHPVCSV